MLATRTRTTNARLPTTLTSRRPSRRRLNYEAGIKPGMLLYGVKGLPGSDVRPRGF
jgi:hypothetical protein